VSVMESDQLVHRALWHLRWRYARTVPW
jgi:hypothetical protein